MTTILKCVDCRWCKEHGDYPRGHPSRLMSRCQYDHADRVGDGVNLSYEAFCSFQRETPKNEWDAKWKCGPEAKYFVPKQTGEPQPLEKIS